MIFIFLKLFFIINFSLQLFSMQAEVDPSVADGTGAPKTFFNRGIKQQVINLIQAANSGLWVAAFSIDEPEIITALTTAFEEKDMKGCVLICAKSFTPSTITESNVPMLSVETLGDGRMHNKFIIGRCNENKEGDRFFLLTGSFNLSKKASDFNLENIVIIYDRNVIAHYIDEFTAIYSGRNSKGCNKAASTKRKRILLPEKLDSVPIIGLGFPRVAFRREIKALILELIHRSRGAIHGAQLFFTDAQIADAWAEKGGSLIVDQGYQENVAIKLATENALKTLQDAEIPVYVLGNDEWQVHHKFIVFENIDNKTVLLTGSANISSNSLEHCWENVFVSDSESLVNKFKVALDGIKQNQQPLAKINLYAF